MSENKTQRKNKTNQVITWPSNDTFFTIKDLVAANQHMLTAPPKCSDITIRVRLGKAITELNTVAEIGAKNGGKGRPEKVFAMRPVLKSVIEAAQKVGMQMVAETKLIPVMEISAQSASITPVTDPTTTPISLNTSETVTA
jgi:hypothetical protein